MEGEKLIKELLSVKKKFENKPVLTFETNIPMMIYDVVNELNRLNSEIESNKHYIELGKAVEKAFSQTHQAMFVTYWQEEECGEHYVDMNSSFNFDSVDDLLEWAEGREND